VHWKLAGETAVVTGGAGGIGREIAAALAGMGARVAVLDINEDGAKEVAAAVGGTAIRVDLTDPDDVALAYERATAELNSVDILVNNAGWDKVGPFVASDPTVWERLISINLRAPIQLTHCALPSMLERGRGRCIFISSDAGRVGSTGEAVYGACKGGIVAFAKTIARESARASVTSNAICPGPTDTPLFDEVAAGNPKLMETLKRAIPLGRLGTPGDVANTVAFLATEQAAYITGQTISVSGGLTMS
jgi:2-hydroxycyclohexanecarboxyl-CoA dehydrogenase